MKHNTSEAKNAIQKALISLPDDFALSEVKHYLVAAINKIDQVENKRAKRQVKQEQRKHIANKSSVFDVRKAVEAIDEEIEKEKSKLDQIKMRMKGSDDEFQTVFG